MQLGADEIAALNQVVQAIEILLQSVDRFMKAAFDQVVDTHVAPPGQQLTPQAVKVVGCSLNGLALDLLQGFIDPCKQ